MKGFTITSENQSQVNEAVYDIMNVFANYMSYEEFIKSLFLGSSELAVRIIDQDQSSMFSDVAGMLNAVRLLTDGLNKLGKLSQEA